MVIGRERRYGDLLLHRAEEGIHFGRELFGYWNRKPCPASG